MRPFFRYLLWLLIALLPLQGGAVALMPYDIGHGGTTRNAMQLDVQPDAEHAERMSMEYITAGLDSPCHDSDSSDSTKAHGHSSHCGSCCVGASVLARVHAPERPITYVTPIRIAVEPAMIAFVPATPERPPRGFI